MVLRWCHGTKADHIEVRLCSPPSELPWATAQCQCHQPKSSKAPARNEVAKLLYLKKWHRKQRLADLCNSALSPCPLSAVRSDAENTGRSVMMIQSV